MSLTNNAGKNALQFALTNSHTGIVAILKARVKALADDRLALLNAVKAGDEESACALIEAGSNVHIKYDDGCNPLIKSSHFGYERIVRSLISHGVDVNVTSGSGNTALMKTAESNFPSIARMLIDAGTDLELHNNDGCCALIRASNYNSIEIVKMIIEAGANINIKSKNGNTALMKACEKGNEEIVAFLLSKGADTTVINKGGLDAVMVANSNGHKVLADMVRKATKNGPAQVSLSDALKSPRDMKSPVPPLTGAKQASAASSPRSAVFKESTTRGTAKVPSAPSDVKNSARRSMRPVHEGRTIKETKSSTKS